MFEIEKASFILCRSFTPKQKQAFDEIKFLYEKYICEQEAFMCDFIFETLSNLLK